MSASAELARKWEGRLIDGKFPLRQWLGGSDHSDVFLTERFGVGAPQKAALKLIPAMALDSALHTQPAPDTQLLCWVDAAKLSHPHLIRLFEYGRCEIDGQPFLYVVMEYAEENLAEILPARVLSAQEASEMLRPAAEALAALHRAGWVHGRIKPSNIMAVGEQLKISSDGVGKPGEQPLRKSAYDAPEVASLGITAAGDIWSLGSILLATMTQREPESGKSDRGPVAVAETIPQPLRDIAKRCLQSDPDQRAGTDFILGALEGRAASVGVRANEAAKRWVAAIMVVLFLLAVIIIASRFMGRSPAIPAAAKPVSSSRSPAEARTAKPPFSGPATQTGTARGSVLQKVMPDVSRSALNTIEGRVKVNVKVQVDSSGNVSGASLSSAGPSKYFAERSLAAARRWKFNTPLGKGQPATSEWVLKFQFRRTGVEVAPAEIKP